jgi:nicotinate-nucleotide adenylyltransferase
MTDTRPIGLLGGTFDPVHMAHLRTALEVYETLDLAEVRLIPCKTPVYTPPVNKTTTVASSDDRLAMLRLAIADATMLRIDPRELLRDTPSYTLETLQSIRSEHPHTPLCFIMGSDTFLTLPSWHRWTEILDYTHIVLVNRPTADLPHDGTLGELLAAHSTYDPHVVQQKLAGTVFVHHMTPLAISSQAIRQQIRHGHSPQFLLPETVLCYIRAQRLYR